MTEEQQRTVARVAESENPTPYELGAIAAMQRQTNDPVIRQQIERTLAKHQGRSK